LQGGLDEKTARSDVGWSVHLRERIRRWYQNRCEDGCDESAAEQNENVSGGSRRQEARRQGPAGLRERLPQGEAREGEEQNGGMQRQDQGHEQGGRRQNALRVHEGLVIELAKGVQAKRFQGL